MGGVALACVVVVNVISVENTEKENKNKLNPIKIFFFMIIPFKELKKNSGLS